MRKNVTLQSIAILTMAGIAACEPTETDDDLVSRPAYGQKSQDQEPPDEDPKAGELVTEQTPAEDVSDTP